jgi:hypothetical protein
MAEERFCLGNLRRFLAADGRRNAAFLLEFCRSKSQELFLGEKFEAVLLQGSLIEEVKNCRNIGANSSSSLVLEVSRSSSELKTPFPNCTRPEEREKHS